MALKYPAIDPVAVSAGPFQIRWYALAYIIGFLAGWRYCLFLLKKVPARRFVAGRKVEREDIDLLMTFLIIGVIVGGRLGYILFYQFEYYAAQPAEVLKIWQGGMSFHGGLLGVIISISLYSLFTGVSLWILYDLVSACAPIGLFFGRIANFVNAELYGRMSDLPWAVIFPTDPERVARHPSQIYEALGEGLILWLVITLFIFKYNALYKTGLVTGLFLLGYGLCRFFIEFTRMPDEQIGFIWGYFTLGQLLCIPMIIVGVSAVIWSMRGSKKVVLGSYKCHD